jgi:hypothetical protein
MSPAAHKEFDRHLQPRERGFPQLALRRRTSDHPLVMFAVIVATAFAAMALVPSPGPAFASIGMSHVKPAVLRGEPNTTTRTGRVALSQADIVCSGQAWGAENEECLLAIARESGRDDLRTIRLVSIAEPDASAPNIF